MHIKQGYGWPRSTTSMSMSRTEEEEKRERERESRGLASIRLCPFPHSSRASANREAAGWPSCLPLTCELWDLAGVAVSLPPSLPIDLGLPSLLTSTRTPSFVRPAR